MAVTWRITLPGNKQTKRKQKTRERSLSLYHALFLTGSRGLLDWAVGLTCIFFPSVNTDCQVLCRLCEMHVATIFPSWHLMFFFLLVHGVCMQSPQCPVDLPTAKESAEQCSLGRRALVTAWCFREPPQKAPTPAEASSHDPMTVTGTG